MSTDRTAANSDARKRNALRDSLVQQTTADAIREAKADAWDEGHYRGVLDAELQHHADNPYRQENDQ